MPDSIAFWSNESWHYVKSFAYSVNAPIAPQHGTHICSVFDRQELLCSVNFFPAYNYVLPLVSTA